MFVVMKENVSTMAGPFLANGDIYDVPDAVGASWVRGGHAIKSDVPPKHLLNIYTRIEVAAGKKALFLPFVGEFGHLIMSHIRIVHFSKAAHKIVCCHRGEEVFYPSADEFFYDWEDPIPDAEKAGTIRPFDRPALAWPEIEARFPGAQAIEGGGLPHAQEHIVLLPERRIPFAPKTAGRHGLKADVCLGVRVREFAAERNFPAKQWQAIADVLSAKGLTFGVVGKKPTSYDLDGQRFHTEGNCDAAIEAIDNCRLWVGTDTGTSHLASTIGKPMVIFRGDSQGQFIDIMRQKNGHHPIHFVPNAHKAQPVLEAIMEALK